jgi:hypothetical protein
MDYVIFFCGLKGQIDDVAAERLAGCWDAEPLYYLHTNWKEAVTAVSRMEADESYAVCGFSRGAATDVMGGFLGRVRARRLRLPQFIMTVGLYGGTRRYRDPHFECINFLDSSGQRHVGEHNAWNLGARVAASCRASTGQSTRPGAFRGWAPGSPRILTRPLAAVGLMGSRPMRGAIPLAQPASAQIDATAKRSPSAALNAEVEEDPAGQFFDPAAPLGAGLFKAGLTLGR